VARLKKSVEVFKIFSPPRRGFECRPLLHRDDPHGHRKIVNLCRNTTDDDVTNFVVIEDTDDFGRVQFTQCY
jgi:hypothetical protein